MKHYLYFGDIYKQYENCTCTSFKESFKKCAPKNSITSAKDVVEMYSDFFTASRLLQTKPLQE